jgi:hypothetical protein
VGRGFFFRFEFVCWLFLNSPHGTSTSNSAVIRLYTSKKFVSSAGMLEGFSQRRQELRHKLFVSSITFKVKVKGESHYGRHRKARCIQSEYCLLGCKNIIV